MNCIRLTNAAVCAAALSALTVPVGAQSVTDGALTVESVITAGSIAAPTAMAFLSASDILVTEKNTGQVRRITSGTVQASPVLNLAVANNSERGLLGIALHPDFPTDNRVYLYYTRAATDGGAALDHRVESFAWNGTSLTSTGSFLTLPVTSGPNHDGGIILFGPPTVAAAQRKLFIVIGDLNRDNQLENFAAGAAADDTACILRVNPDFTTPTGTEKGPFFDVAGGNASLERLYAYGVRNSFGMDFDPSTGALWDTENGAAAYDEVNRVDPAFNSGWQRVMGPLSRGNFEGAPGLVQFGGVGTYTDPKFSWLNTVAPTGIHFMLGPGIGAAYDGDCFVGDSNNGRLYKFEMNASRDGFVLSGDVADLVFDPTDTLSLIQFGSSFGAVTDIETGPDGYLYVASIGNNTVYRVKPLPVASVGEWGLY
jgi:glucose/arabinose dehydrogenase